jgi:hypothetical protein
MYTEDYTPSHIEEFNGIFNRGSLDSCPKDHSPDALNVFFESGKVKTRGNLAASYGITHTAVRQFLSTIGNAYRYLSCNGAGNIYANNASIFSAANLVDFAAINIGNLTYIAPITSSGDQILQVYNGTTCRPAAGLAPTSSFTATEPDPGNVDAGLHKIAVSFITDSAFTTQPGPKIADVFTPVEITSSGGLNISLSGIPLGPAGTVARRIFVTKANLSIYYFVDGGLIEDNTTTTLDLNFYDTDLSVSADYLFDLRETIPVGASNYGGMSLQKYSNCLLIVGGSGDFIFVSQPGDYESFNSVIGLISMPTENDGNQVRAAVEHYDVLYIFKAVGIYSVQDNLSGDSSTWKVIGPIEGAIGAYPNAIGTITKSIPGLTTEATIVLANKSGMFGFNGSIQHPPLTWKIQGIWDRMTNDVNQIELAIDPFLERIYVNICVDGSSTPNMLLCADYRDGLNRDAIVWTVLSFPYTPRSIAMLNFNDGVDFNYYLRLSMNSTLYKLTATMTGLDLGSMAISSYVETALVRSETVGAVDVYPFVRYSVAGAGTFRFKLYNESGTELATGPTQAITTSPARWYMQRVNVETEALYARFFTSDAGSYFHLMRATLLHTFKYSVRPDA